MTNFDMIVIGSGPGGYTAAIRAAQLGYKTAIVEKYPSLGGTCTNVGCIPAKALLDSTEHYHNALTKFKNFGIHLDSVRVDREQFFKRKSDVVIQNVAGINFLMKKNKITVIYGTASFLNNEDIEIKDVAGSVQTVKGKYIIIATGSKPVSIPNVPIDKERIITSTEALSLPEIPASMAIIGGGVIGVEMASVYARIGVKVTIIEYADRLIPTMDQELGKELQKILAKNGIQILVSQKVQSAKNNGKDVTVNFLDKDQSVQKLNADYCLVAVGRGPFTKGLGLENTRIELDEKGRILTNAKLETTLENVFAIGDVIKGPMLAHKAEDEAVFVVETIAGSKPHIKYNLIPAVVYTWPEVASVGATEEELIKNGIAYRKGKFPFTASGRGRAAGDTEGFSKVLSDPRYGEILGVHIIGARAADLIGQAVINMEFEITDSASTTISYAHPTYSETLKEAYLIASGKGSLNI
ncbi:dihydrolipoyl dehydrogenase [Dyadobacter psychrotolerans]|uniref:Dihydrolipoyl dehydrogenase n=1 Tax=Dyadobacter psychrotolerans TaxID=2541721 RepID=A0A4R5DJ08_9BACT|nr:dihydrolipoyl dehydrogenase [Dyadobacter psychrotolerans]TDE10775.1 dihydrolipoyl dehydrogenase [Dyadobacter psychrotolerans]